MLLHISTYQILEDQPWIAVHNNVTGTLRLAKAATMHQVKRFVLISTDKAVEPTSIMGATKRLAEKLCLTLNQGSKTHFSVVAIW